MMICDDGKPCQVSAGCESCGCARFPKLLKVSAQPTELEHHKEVKDAGFESVGELLAAYKRLMEQAPVAWMLKTGHGHSIKECKENPMPSLDWPVHSGIPAWKPLYAAPKPDAQPTIPTVPVSGDVIENMVVAAYDCIDDCVPQEIVNKAMQAAYAVAIASASQPTGEKK